MVPVVGSSRETAPLEQKPAGTGLLMPLFSEAPPPAVASPVLLAAEPKATAALERMGSFSIETDLSPWLAVQ
jgi:hypothetical protein